MDSLSHITPSQPSPSLEDTNKKLTATQIISNLRSTGNRKTIDYMGLNHTGILNIQKLPSDLLDRLLAQVWINQAYNTLGSMPDSINPDISITNRQHSKLYSRLKYGAKAIFQLDMLNTANHFDFLDNYLRIHFKSEIFMINQVNHSDPKIGREHQNMHDGFMKYWNSEIMPFISNYLPANYKTLIATHSLTLEHVKKLKIFFSDENVRSEFMGKVVKFYEMLTNHIGENDKHDYGIDDFQVLGEILNSFNISFFQPLESSENISVSDLEEKFNRHIRYIETQYNKLIGNNKKQVDSKVISDFRDSIYLSLEEISKIIYLFPSDMRILYVQTVLLKLDSTLGKLDPIMASSMVKAQRGTKTDIIMIGSKLPLHPYKS